MEQTVKKFIQNLFLCMGIHVKWVASSCADPSELDLGLRTNIFGIDEDMCRLYMEQEYRRFQPCVVYNITDTFDLSYSCMRLPQGNCFLLIGPVLFERMHRQRLNALMKKLELPEHLHLPLERFYQGVPVVPLQSLYENAVILAADYILGQGTYRVEYTSMKLLDEWIHFQENYWKIPEKPFDTIHLMEERYDLENALLNAVCQGNDAQALKLHGQWCAGSVPERLSNPLRDEKDCAITLNTLLRKAVEQSKVHPIHIDNLSNDNVKRIESLTSVDAVRNFQRTMIYKYCQMVKNYSFQTYSLPIRKVITYVSSDLTADLSLKNLAKQLNLNASYLSTLFKREMGISLTEYVNGKRIRHAQLLLKTTNLPLKTISVQCGITDIRYFNRVFKCATGVTPKIYRSNAANKLI